MGLPFIGRRKPYTWIGIRRKKCVRCGAKATCQWNACANGGRYVPLCYVCDREVNRMVLEYMFPEITASELMLHYKPETEQ